MQEEWGRRLRRLGTGVTTSGAGLPSPGEDEERSRSPTKGETQGVLSTPFAFMRKLSHRLPGKNGSSRRKWGLYGFPAPEQDAAEERESWQLLGPLRAQTPLTVRSLPPHPSGPNPLPARSAPPP